MTDNRMYVSVTRTRDPLHQPLDVATIAGEEMLPWLSQIEGFEGLLMLSNEAEATTLTLSFWESEEVAERHHVARAEFRDRITSAVNVQVEETVGYEVTFSHLGPRLAEHDG
jgi:heme-degrading monooxygenase HmoA